MVMWYKVMQNGELHNGRKVKEGQYIQCEPTQIGKLIVNGVSFKEYQENFKPIIAPKTP